MAVRLAIASALLCLVSACAQIGAMERDQSSDAQQAQEFLPDGGPPVTNGFYDAHGSCPFEGCTLGDLYTTGPVPLLERPALDARVVTTAPAGEWLKNGNSIMRLRPSRGVVVGEVHHVYDSGHGVPVLEIGDVVYAVDYEGEGMTQLWRRGEMISWLDEGNADEIRWVDSTPEQRSAADAAGAGWWLELVRANGERGWVRDHANLDCMGVIDAAPRCEEHWAASRQ